MLPGYPSAAFSIAAHRLPQSIMDTTLDALAPPVQCAKVETPPQKDDAQAVLAGLPLRQRQVVEGIACGLTNKEIARELGITEGTVKVHARLAYVAIGVNNRVSVAMRFGAAGVKTRAALAAWAVRNLPAEG